MQTARQVERKIRHMIHANNLRDDLVKTALHLYKSGAIDPGDYSDKAGEGLYILPKLLLAEALRREALEYTPFSKGEKKVLRNLRHF